MQIQTPYGQLPGGFQHMGSPGANVLSMDGGAGMPPSPGAAGTPFSAKDSGQIQQKMARQRQLALERRRMAGRMAGGCMAQANQLPTTQVQAKAPGWDNVLRDGIDKPGSLAEKAEAAFSDAKKTSVAVKTSGIGEKVDDNFKVEPESQASLANASASPIEAQPKISSQNSLEEIEDFDIDFGMGGNAPKPVLIQKGGDDSEVKRPVEQPKSWNMQLDPTPAIDVGHNPTPLQQQQMHDAAQAAGQQSKWYKPSTWRSARSVPAPAAGASNEVTAVTSNTDIQRLGVSTPPDGNNWSVPRGDFSSPNNNRRGQPRRRIAESPPPSSQPALDLDFMACPGAIDDGPLPTVTAPAAKVITNPKHHSESVDRAAFPSEERAAQRRRQAEEEAEKAAAAEREKQKEFEAWKAQQASAANQAAQAPAQPKAPTSRMAELEAQKKDAIAREDFMEAQRIKSEIEKLQSQQSAPAPAVQSPVAAAGPSSFAAATQIETIPRVDEPQGQPAAKPARGRRFFGARQPEPAPTPDANMVSSFDA